VLSARGWIEALEFNTVQNQARWDEFVRDPEAFARKFHPGHGVDSYPVQTNTGRIREKLDKLSRKRERNRLELEEAEANLRAVEVQVLSEVELMRPSDGGVPWPKLLEAHETFMKRVMAEAYRERAEAPERRKAKLAEIDRQYNEEIAALEIEREAELEEMCEDMKSWTEAERAEFRRVMGAIAQGLRDKTLSPGDIGDFIKCETKRL
jgi:hypothetical protein